MTDFDVIQHGTLAQIVPNTLEAEDWLRENVEQTTTFGRTVCVEPRYLAPIMAGITEAGMTQTLDGRECEVREN